MRSFKTYLVGATVFAAAITGLSMDGDVAKFIGQFDVLVFIPILMAILVSGNVHQPSEFGAYLGFFIQWFIVGLAVGTIVWTIARRKTDAAT